MEVLNVTNDTAVIARLEALIEVTRDGYREIREEIKALREDFKDGQAAHGERLLELERDVNRLQGGVALARVVTGSSLLAAIVSSGVAIILALS